MAFLDRVGLKIPRRDDFYPVECNPFRVRFKRRMNFLCTSHKIHKQKEFFFSSKKFFSEFPLRFNYSTAINPGI